MNKIFNTQNMNTFENYDIIPVETITEEFVNLLFFEYSSNIECTYSLKKFLKEQNLYSVPIEQFKQIKNSPHIRDISKLFRGVILEIFLGLIHTKDKFYIIKTPKMSFIYTLGEILLFENDLLVRRDNNPYNIQKTIKTSNRTTITKYYTYANDRLISSSTNVFYGNYNNYILMSQRYYSYIDSIDKSKELGYNLIVAEVNSIKSQKNIYLFKYDRIVQIKCPDGYKRIMNEFGDCIFSGVTDKWCNGKVSLTQADILYNTYDSYNRLIKIETGIENSDCMEYDGYNISKLVCKRNGIETTYYYEYEYEHSNSTLTKIYEINSQNKYKKVIFEMNLPNYARNIL